MKQFWMMVNGETGEVLGMDKARTQLESLKLFMQYKPNLNGFKMVPNVKTWQAFNPLKKR